MWRRLGAQVTVVEFLDQILAGMDGEVSKAMLRILQKQGMAFKLGSKVSRAERSETGVRLTHRAGERRRGGDTGRENVLVSVGRRPNTAGLGLESVGITLDNRGFIPVDHDYQTKVPGIFAIGDVIGGKMLAHKAEEEGVAVAELIAGQAGHVNYEAIPGVVYTWPEVAAVGRTEEQLKADGMAYKVGKFPFSANSRARCNADTDGFVKILADAPDRPHPRRAYRRPRSWRPDPGDRRRHGVRRLGRGPGALQPRPSRPCRSDQGGGSRRRRPRDPHLTASPSPRPSPASRERERGG